MHIRCIFTLVTYFMHILCIFLKVLAKTVLIKKCIFDAFCCKVMRGLFNFWPKNIKNVTTTLQGLRIKTNLINQICLSLKSMMQYCDTNFSDSATFNEKSVAKNWGWTKV